MTAPHRILVLALALLATSCASHRYRMTAINSTRDGARAMARNDLLLAHESYRRALDSAEQAELGPIVVCSARYNLALSLGTLCQHQDAQRLVEHSLRDLDALEESEATTAYRSRFLFTLGNLAYDRKICGDAANYYGRAVTFADQVQAEEKDPSRYAKILDRYADSLKRAGQPDAAAKVSQRATDMRKAHPASTPVRGRLRYDGFDNAAEQLLGDLRRAEAVEGPKGPTVTARLLWLGVLESNRGNNEAALAYFERGFANQDNDDDTEDVSMATALDRYAHVLRASQRDAEARNIEARAAALRKN